MKGRKRKASLTDERPTNQTSILKFFQASGSTKKRKTDEEEKENLKGDSGALRRISALVAGDDTRQAQKNTIEPSFATSFSSSLQLKRISTNGGMSLGAHAGNLRAVSKKFGAGHNGVLNGSSPLPPIESESATAESLLGGKISEDKFGLLTISFVGPVKIQSPSQKKPPPSKERKTTLGALSNYVEGSETDRGLSAFKYRRGEEPSM